MRVSGKAAVTIIVKALPIQTTKIHPTNSLLRPAIRNSCWRRYYVATIWPGRFCPVCLRRYIYIYIYLYTIYISLYIFNAFISGHVGTPEIAGRYLAVFQVLISSRTGYHPPSAGGGAPSADWKLRPLYRPPPFYPHHRLPASLVTPPSASTSIPFSLPTCSFNCPPPTVPPSPATQLRAIEDESLDIAVVSARIFGLRFSRLFGNKTGTSLHWYRLHGSFFSGDVSGFATATLWTV